MPPDLIVTVESDAVPGSSSTSTRIEPEVSLPSPAIVSMPVPLAPTTISCDPVVHSEPASSMLATPSAPSCSPATRRRRRLGPFASARRRRRGRPAPPRRSRPPLGILARSRSRPNAPRASRLRSARERLRKRPASRSGLAQRQRARAHAPFGVLAGKQHLAEGPSSIPTRAPLLEDRAVLTSFPDLFWLMPACTAPNRSPRSTDSSAGALISPGSPVSVIDCAPAPHGAISIAAAAQARGDSSAGTAGARDFGHDRPRPDTRWRRADVVHIVASESVPGARWDALPDMETTLS